MFRTVTVYRGEKLSVNQNRLVVTDGEKEQKILPDDRGDPSVSRRFENTGSAAV